MKNKKNKIDIVITWVDGNDPAWRKEFNKYNPKKINDTNDDSRFRDWDTLRYVFRSIEKFMPWVNKIHLVTMDQCPEWLDKNNSKINLVSHRDIFQDKSHLPTFNSSAIELNFLGIDGLAEQFILFNDDTMLLKPLNEKYFFEKGFPKDFLIQNIVKDILTKRLFPDNTWVHNIDNIMKIINKEFDKKSILSQHHDKYINKTYGLIGNIKNIVANLFNKYYLFEHYHHPQPYLKKTWQNTFIKYKKEILNTSSHKFREKEDITDYFFRYQHLVKGEFIPQYNKNFVTVNVNSVKKAKKCADIMKKYTFICINDDPMLSEKKYLEARKIVLNGLNKIMPDKSSFEV